MDTLFEMPSDLEGWAGLYETSTKSISRWRKKGGVDDPPPLDRPGLMLGWYGRHHKQAAPLDLQSAISKAVGVIGGGGVDKGGAGGGASDKAGDKAAGGSGFVVPRVSRGAGVEVDFMSAHAMLQRNLLDAEAALAAAKVAFEKKEIASIREYQISFAEAQKQFMEGEKAKAKILADAGQTAPLEVVASVLNDLLAPVPKRIRRELKGRREAVLEAVGDVAAWSKFVDTFLDDVSSWLQLTQMGSVVEKIQEEAA